MGLWQFDDKTLSVHSGKSLIPLLCPLPNGGPAGFAFDCPLTDIIPGLGVLCIFPPFQGRNLATHALALMQSYVFQQLGLTHFRARCHGDNNPVIRLGEKMGFRRELAVQGLIGYGGSRYDEQHRPNPDEEPKPTNTKDNKPADKGDLREPFKMIEGIAASMVWTMWPSSIGKHFANEVHCRTTSPVRFRNDWEPSRVLEPSPQHQLSTSVADYDHNYKGPVTELQSSKAVLVPFIVSCIFTNISFQC